MYVLQGVNQILCFSLKCCDFLNSASSGAALVFDLPLCTHTDTEGTPRETRVGIYILKSSKKLNI